VGKLSPQLKGSRHMGSLFLFFIIFTAWITFPPLLSTLINITTNLNYFPKNKEGKKGFGS